MADQIFIVVPGHSEQGVFGLSSLQVVRFVCKLAAKLQRNANSGLPAIGRPQSICAFEQPPRRETGRPLRHIETDIPDRRTI